MDGAGIMNLPTNVGGSTSQDGLDSYAPLIAAQQTARDMGYPRFTRELLAAGSEMDPVEVQEFLQTIRDAGLTSEDVALMRRVVEAVFGDPNNYPEVRARLLAEGVPEDLLPETFDLEFFTALRMAAEEAENIAQEPRPTEQEMPMGMPAEMAEGGIVGLPQLTPVARELASMGRNGDTMLAHITPQEAMMLKRMGGSGSINPYTGLPEFFLKGVFKGIKKAINGVVKGVKKFAKSTVGRMITAVALGAFLGPAAAGFMGVSSAAGVAAMSGAIGGFGSSILAGDGLKNALRSGLTGAVLAGGMAGITGGSAAFQARPELQAAYQQQGFLGTVKQTAQNYFGSPVDTAKQMYGTEAAPKPGVGTAQELVQTQPPAAGTGPQPGGFSDFTQGTPQGPMALEGPVQPRLLAPEGSNLRVMTDPVSGGRRLVSEAGINVQQGLPAGLPSPSSINVPADLSQGLPGGTGYQGGNLFDRITQGAKDIYSEYISPSRASIQGRSADTIFSELTAKGLPSTADTFKLATDMAAKEAPGTLAKFGPVAALGTAAAAATGGLDSLMKTPEMPMLGMTPEQRAEAQETFLRENPQFRGPIVRPEYYSQPTYRAARGSGPEGVKDFPRKNGHISGPGTGTSDDIPAMLSDGEFVFTAKAVRNMGGGSRRKGAAKMYKLMKMLEGGPVGKTAKA